MRQTKMRIWVVIAALVWAAHSTGSHRDLAVGDAAPGSLGDAPARAPAFAVEKAEGRSSQLPDFAAMDDIAAKKAAFYAYMLPLIREANADVARERRALLAMRDTLLQQGELSSENLQMLADLERRYRLDASDTWVARRVGNLLRRVDVVPESLVLAQAAKESGWGTSRFAREGNNLFGIWCFTEGCGLTPRARAEHLAHEVQRFDAVIDGVRHYLRTINTHEAYSSLRTIRAQARRDNATLHGELLAVGLERYSERGTAYVREIQLMIRYNQLQRFTEARHSA